MSVSKWAYEPKKCDGDYCPGDCDLCDKSEESEEEGEEASECLITKAI